MEFWPCFDIFHRLWPYLCFKQEILGFYKQATHRRRGDEAFFSLGPPFMTGDGPKMVHFGPKMAWHGRLFNVPKWSKRVQNGQPNFFDQLGPFLAHLDPFGQFQIRNDLLSQMDKVGFPKYHWFTEFSGKDVTKWIPYESYIWIYSTIQISFIFQMLGRKDFSLLLSFSFILISRQASGSRKNVLFIGSDDLRPNLGFFEEVKF